MDEPTCAGCRELLKRVAELEAKLRELEARLGQNASNSSIPPSANPPQAPPHLRSFPRFAFEDVDKLAAAIQRGRAKP